MKRLLFYSVCSLFLAVNSEATSLKAEIEAEYKTFKGQVIPNLHTQPCKAVQFIEYLRGKSNDKNAFQKISMIMLNGTGVGGISNRPATQDERKIMFQALRQAVDNKAFPNLQELRYESEEIKKHQSVVMRAAEVLGYLKNKPVNFLTDPQEYQRFVHHVKKTELNPNNNQLQLNGRYTQSANLLYIESPTVGVNPLYPGSHFPKAPLLHPYSPTGGDQTQGTNSGAFPSLLVRVKFPMTEYRHHLPPALQEKIRSVPDSDIELFFITQTRPSNAFNIESPLLFRPHYWLSPNGSGWQAPVATDFIKTPLGETLQQEASYYDDIHVHDNVVSPHNYSVEHLLTKGHDLAFWSWVHNPGTNRYALTLHWLLTTEANKDLRELLRKNSSSLRTFADLARLFNQSDRFRKLYHFAF